MRDVEYNLVECRGNSINGMNKTFDELDDDVHPSNEEGYWEMADEKRMGAEMER